MFNGPNNLYERIESNGFGLVRLWYSPNIFETEWKIEGEYGEDCFYYFIVPPGFYLDGNEFKYNFPYQYVYKQRTVTGYVYHSGVRDLIDGKTEYFWSLDEQENVTCQLNTDMTSKLPYLLFPQAELGFRSSIGEDRRYFIPVGELA